MKKAIFRRFTGEAVFSNSVGRKVIGEASKTYPELHSSPSAQIHKKQHQTIHPSSDRKSQHDKHTTTILPKPSYSAILQGHSQVNLDSSPKLISSTQSATPQIEVDTEAATFQPISSFQGKTAVLFPIEAKSELVDKLKYVLVGKFSHGRPSWLKIKEFFHDLKLTGLYNLSIFDQKHLYIECSNKIDFNRLWLKFQWLVDGCAMRILKWEPEFKPAIESPIVPVWIRLEGIPLYMFEEMPLLHIANVVGKPIRIDSRNINRTMLNKALICVELDISKPLKASFEVCFEDKTTGVVSDHFNVDVFYDNIPSYCSGCSHVGHKMEHCKRSMPKSMTALEKGKEIMQNVSDIRMNDGASSSKIAAENDKNEEEAVEVDQISDQNSGKKLAVPLLTFSDLQATKVWQPTGKIKAISDVCLAVANGFEPLATHIAAQEVHLIVQNQEKSAACCMEIIVHKGENSRADQFEEQIKVDRDSQEFHRSEGVIENAGAITEKAEQVVSVDADLAHKMGDHPAAVIVEEEQIHTSSQEESEKVSPEAENSQGATKAHHSKLVQTETMQLGDVEFQKQPNKEDIDHTGQQIGTVLEHNNSIAPLMVTKFDCLPNIEGQNAAHSEVNSKAIILVPEPAMEVAQIDVFNKAAGVAEAKQGPVTIEEIQECYTPDLKMTYKTVDVISDSSAQEWQIVGKKNNKAIGDVSKIRGVVTRSQMKASHDIWANKVEEDHKIQPKIKALASHTTKQSKKQLERKMIKLGSRLNNMGDRHKMRSQLEAEMEALQEEYSLLC